MLRTGSIHCGALNFAGIKPALSRDSLQPPWLIVLSDKFAGNERHLPGMFGKKLPRWPNIQSTTCSVPAYSTGPWGRPVGDPPFCSRLISN
jgi:hypothetical protein